MFVCVQKKDNWRTKNSVHNSTSTSSAVGVGGENKILINGVSRVALHSLNRLQSFIIFRQFSLSVYDVCSFISKVGRPGGVGYGRSSLLLDRRRRCPPRRF